MRVNDLGLFLQVEGLLVVFDVGLRKFTVVMLTVVREESLWVRVTHKAIDAASLTRALIASGKRFEGRILPDRL